MTDELKSLRARFLSLTDTADINKMTELQRDFQKYLKTNEDNEYNQCINTINVLKALIKYEETYDGTRAYHLVKPMLVDFEFGKKIEYLEGNYNKKLLIMSISVSGSFRQAIQIVEDLEKSFEIYPTTQEVENEFRVFTYINFTSKLLYDKTTIRHTPEEALRMQKLFVQYMARARQFCEKMGKEDWLAILNFRSGLFFDNSEMLSHGMYLARSAEEHEIYKSFHRDFDMHVDMQDMRKTLAKNVGKRIRGEREDRGLSVSELAKFIEVSPNALTQFEQGKRDISLGSLLVVSYLFNIPLQELVAQ